MKNLNAQGKDGEATVGCGIVMPILIVVIVLGIILIL